MPPMMLLTPLRATVALVLLAAALTGCGADPGPGPAGDAGADVVDEQRTACQFVNRLDCDGDPTNGCETRIDEANCGVCGRRCPAGAICTTQGDRCLE